MEWQREKKNTPEHGGDHSIFGEAPRKYSLAEAAEKSDDELYRAALQECERIVSENPELVGNPEIVLEVERRTGVGIGIAALAASNVGRAA